MWNKNLREYNQIERHREIRKVQSNVSLWINYVPMIMCDNTTFYPPKITLLKIEPYNSCTG